MAFKKRKLLKEERGSAILLVGAALALLLATAGLVIDGGTLYATRAHLQKTANAAALSGAQELTGQEAQVNAVVDDILQKHNEAASLAGTDINLMSDVRVHLQKQVNLGFARLFGFTSVPVRVEAAAQIFPMGSAVGVAPLGIDDSIPLDYNTTYKLKVDNTGVVAGNFGILALGGTGAATYEDNLMHGYQSSIDIGKIIDTQTGNIAGKTRTSVQYRIDKSPYLPGDTSHRDDPRIILIPTYHPVSYTGNQLKQIKVTGFAYFYILEPMSSQDTSITGMFIKKTGTGFTETGSLDKGAYAIKLVP